MANDRTTRLLGRLRALVLDGADGVRTDQELLARYLADRNEEAFAALVRRHAALVWGVCRRLLRNDADAEDAFQATFLVLIRKAGSIRRRASLGSFLHGVARQVARKIIAVRVRNQRQPPRTPEEASGPETEVSWREVRAVLDEEIERLPEKYRAPLLLCYLAGLTQDEAARQLGWTPGVFRGRLDRGRNRLRARLVRRGIALSTALLGSAFGGPADAAPVSVVVATARDAGAVGLSPPVVALAEGVLRAMLLNRVKVATVVGALVCVVALAVGLSVPQLPAQDTVKPPAQPPAASDLERRVAELEKQVQRLTKELEDVKTRSGGKPQAPSTPENTKNLLNAEGDTRVIQLKNVTAVEAARVLKEMFGADNKRVQIVTDERTNSLIVKSSPTDYKVIGDMIATIDGAPGKPGQPMNPKAAESMFKAVTLKKLDGAEAVTVLEKIFKGRSVKFAFAAPNVVAVFGPQDEVFDAVKIILELEEAVPKAGKP